MNVLSPDADREFIEIFQALQEVAYDTACRKGWWETPQADGTLIALMHSELSEALEGLRKGNPESVKIPPHSNVEEELSDVIIRIMDYAEHNNLKLGQAILRKLSYNERRDYKHGGKKF